FPACGVDRMGDVGVQLGPALGAADGAVLVQPVAALIAEAGPQMVLEAAAAAVGQLSARHRDEGALEAFDDLEIADDEHVVEGDGTKGLEAVSAAGLIHELDANFRDVHRWTLLVRDAENPFLVALSRPTGRPRLFVAASFPACLLGLTKNVTDRRKKASGEACRHVQSVRTTKTRH